MTADQLHPSAERVLLAVGRYWRQRGIPPAVHDVAELAGLRAKSSAYYWLCELRDEGYLDWDDRTFRSLRLTPRGLEHLYLTEADA